MMQWFPAALISLFSFGLWGLFTKLAIMHIDSKSALVFQTLGVLIIGIVTLSLLNFKPSTDFKGLTYGLLTGITYGIGCLFYFIAADKGKVTTVVTLTAFYPLITVIFSHFLFKETISSKQYFGIGFALIAIFLMSS